MKQKGTRSRTPSAAKAKALRIAKLVSDQHAEDIVVLDVSNVSSICDYFVICSGTSGRHVRAIYEEAIHVAKREHIDISHYEGDESERWVLVDFFDIMLHIFQPEARAFYDLERLWGNAKKVPLKKYLAQESPHGK